MNSEAYETYRHRFAMWTACRAVQRGFVNTKLICEIIQLSNLQKSIKEITGIDLTELKFDKWHEEITARLITQANKKGVVMSYGRAAKIIAIYLKTSQILQNPECLLSKFAHPPIDKKLLTEIRENFRCYFFNQPYKPWSMFEKDAYCETIKVLRKIQSEASMTHFWMLEKYWTP